MSSGRVNHQRRGYGHPGHGARDAREWSNDPACWAGDSIPVRSDSWEDQGPKPMAKIPPKLPLISSERGITQSTPL